MAGRPLQDFPQGECGWKVLDKLRRERSIAIDNLSRSSSSRSITGTRLPPIESPVPRLMVNSQDVDSEGEVFEGDLDGELNVGCDNVLGNDSPWNPTDNADGDAGRVAKSPSPVSSDEVPDELTHPSFLGLSSAQPGDNVKAGLLRRRSSAGELDILQKEKDLLGHSLGSSQLNCMKQGLSRSRSPSPAFRKATVATVGLTAPVPKPRSPQTSSRPSPGSSPEVSPNLTRRRSSLTLPPPTTGNARGPPTNTEARLRTRSAQYKLQKFLKETKSQFTTAQTLEMYAQSTAAAAEQK